MAGRSLRIFLIIVLAAVVAYLCTQLWKAEKSAVSLPEGRERFVEVVKGRRPCEGRLSWGFDYAPYSATARHRDLAEYRKAFQVVERLAERKGDAEGWDALGVLHLFQDQPERAVPYFERAVSSQPSEARLLTHLAVGYVDRARKLGDPLDWFRALDAADQAVTADGEFPAALFNRALALEYLFLPHQAQEAWEEYLQVDPTSKWAQEAKHRIKRLQEPSGEELWQKELGRLEIAVSQGDAETVAETVRRFTGPVRQHVEEDLLGRWGDEILEGSNATGTLAAARALSRALAEVRGEHGPQDAVAVIDQALARNDAGLVTTLAQGHRDYRNARQRHERNERADDLLRLARNAFLQGASPAADWTALHLAIGSMGQQMPKAQEALGNLRRRVPERYPLLLGRVEWALGMTHLALGDPVASLHSYRSALRRFERLGAAEDAAGVRNVLAENLLYLGDWPGVWKNLYHNLAATSQIRSRRRLLAILDQTAETAARAGQWEASERFRDEVVRISEESGDPVKLTHALLQRSGTSFQAGNAPSAWEDLGKAREALERIADAVERRRVEADLQIVEGEITARDDPAHAVGALTGALTFYRDSENRFPLARIYLARARAHHSLNDPDLSEADYERGIAEFEMQRARVPAESLQISFFERSQALFREMVRLQADRKEPEKAFDFAERWRARALLDRLGGLQVERAREIVKATPVLGADEIRGELPGGVALLQYAVLADRLLLWVVRTDRLRVVTSTTTGVSIDAMVLSLRKEVMSSSDQASGSAEALYDLLVRPALPHLEPQDRIVIVPDGSLHEVPFAALRDRTTRRFLIQDRILSIAPSATFYIEALRRERVPRSQGRGNLLAVGNPRFRRSSFPLLQDLTSSEREAAVLAARVPGSKRVPPEEATKAQFLAEVGEYEVIHFAGHASVNRERPLMSYLVMAPADAEDMGVLYAHELYGIHLERTRLVVLAACSTAQGPANGEGVQSLARAFLAAGVPTVVASLWDIEDRVAAELLDTFHARLLAGDDAATALRFAQLHMLSQDHRALRSPKAWAAFQVLGGNFTRVLNTPRSKEETK